jgi:thiosulfate dehydrogenase
MKIILFFLIQVFLMTSSPISYALEKSSDPLDEALTRGNALFVKETLGNNTTGMSCASCHPAGKTTGGSINMDDMSMPIPTLIGAAATFPKYKAGAGKVVRLEQMNNMCITMIMKGKALDLESQEAVDLAAYVTSLSYKKPMQKGKTMMMQMDNDHMHHEHNKY